ncbi:MAG: hypothetical protein K1X55_17880 [Chitinophagales bacterium]|nr:hypothetical protein [Chitinophagales bacterium]
MKQVLVLMGVLCWMMIMHSCSQKKMSEWRMPVNQKKSTTLVDKLSQEEAEKMTIQNMKQALECEYTASVAYQRFSEKAQEEGYKSIANLFIAFSIAEGIHAENHSAVLKEMGGKVNYSIEKIDVKTTKENIAYSIFKEKYEVADFYPNFISEATLSKSSLARISLNYAYQTEKKHKMLLEEALKTINDPTTNIAKVFYVCPTCGNTYMDTIPARCGISLTESKKFNIVKIL